MPNEQTDTVSWSLVSQIDSTNPAMADIRRPADEGQHQAAALAFVAYLRRRPLPKPEFSGAFIRDLRERAGASRIQTARESLERAVERPPKGSRLFTPQGHVEPLDMLLGATPEIGERIAERVLAVREQWGNGGWGTTSNIVGLLRRMLCIPEFRDETLLPPLGWLLEQTVNEWNWARSWNEAMLGNSGHNWWLHTYLGFFKAGLFFPELKRLRRFQSLGAAFFEREGLMLLESDGFTRERSGYHYGTFRMFLEFQDLAEEFGFSLSREFHARIAAAASLEWKVRAPTGDLPHLGDGFADYSDPDMSKAVQKPDATQEKRNRAKGLALRLLAARFQMPEAKFVAERLTPDWSPVLSGLLLQGEHNLWPAYERLPSRPPESVDTALPATGYYFMRQDWTPKADWMSIEAGPTGTIVSSHDHTDIFSIELYSRGRPILVDNGSGPYGDEPSRRWRVGSAGHNVAMIDGKDQIPARNEWRWENAVSPFTEAWIRDARYAYFSGAHEGYRSLPEPVASARRKIFYLRGRYWILIDRFTPETGAEHDYTLHFHVRPPCRLNDDGSLVTTGAGGNLLIAPVPGLDGRANLEPCPYPLEGYVKPEHLSYSSRGKGPMIFATLLVPFEDTDVPDVAVGALKVESDERVLTPWEATALEITVNGRRDVYFDQHMAWNLPWQAGGCSGEGRLFHSAAVERENG